MTRQEFVLITKIIVEYTDRYSNNISYEELLKRLEKLMEECED